MLLLQGFRSVYKPRRDGAVAFAELLDRVAALDPEMRVRFTSPHPKDFADEVLQVGGGCTLKIRVV
jgi:tRNA A37 methylthiotransferase MiaB